jgi:hypothetical protein
MLGSNPSADSVASTDPNGDATASPFYFSAAGRNPPIGRGIKALNPGGVGAKPPQRCTGADNFLRKQSALS